MKLLITIIEDDDAHNLIEKLATSGFKATKLASTGGFLLRGNTTLFIGADNHQVDQVLEIIGKVCTRRKKVLPSPAAELPPTTSMPIEIEVGGATIFVLGVAEFTKLLHGPVQ